MNTPFAAVVGAAIVLGWTGLALAAELGSRDAPIVIVEPDRVVSSPSKVYPDRALRMEQSGTATITCLVSDDGRLTDCFVKSEAPANYGFGQSTIDLSRHFRMNATTAEGVSLHGRWVSLTSNFTLDCPPKAAKGIYISGVGASRRGGAC